MLARRKVFKTILLIFWGLLLFLAISNQEMSLEDVLATKDLPIKSSEYQFAETEYDEDALQKYRIDHEDGNILFGYTRPEEFTNILSFNFRTSKHIKFSPVFHRTKGCMEQATPDRYRLVVTVEDIEHRFEQARDEHGDLVLEIPANAQLGITVQASENSCGAIEVTLTRVQNSSWVEYLLINALWAVTILLMLVSRHLFLPLLSGLTFYLYVEANSIYSLYLSWEQLSLYSGLAISLGLIFSILSSVGKNRFVGSLLARVVSLLLVVAVWFFPVVVLVFEEMFDVPMNQFDWFAVLQTDITEAMEFMTVFAPSDLVYMTLLGCVSLLFIAWVSGRKKPTFLLAHGALLLICISFIALFNRHSLVISESLSAISQFYEDAAMVRAKVEQRKKEFGTLIATKQESGELYVVILGESANRSHFSMYGYPRDTNPLLRARHDRGDLIRYEQSYSGGVSTRGSLGWALTSARVKEGSANTSPSIIEVLNAADFDTYWLKNGSTSVSSNILGMFAEQADYMDQLSSIYGVEDGKLLTEVDKALEKQSTKNQAIFLRTQGSHIAYCKRLPGEKQSEWRFSDDDYYRWLVPDKYKLTYISNAASCYDGTVKYTDYFVDEVIKRVERSGKVASVIYFSDHGDEIVRGTAHMGNAPTYGVFSVPMFLWFSKDYQRLYPRKYQNAIENSGKVFVNDVMFDSMLGLMSVESDESKLENDISSTSYKERKWVYRGKKTVYDADNDIFYTPRNIAAIKAANRSYNVYLGLEHPFHLAWVTGEHQYNHVALSAIYQNGVFNLNSPLYRKKIVPMDTVLNYLKADPSQNIIFRIDLDESGNGRETEVAEKLLSLLNKHGIDKARLRIASSDRPFLDALLRLDVRVSQVLEFPDIKERAYASTTVDLADLPLPQKIENSGPVDVWISACHINTCGAEYFKQLDLLAEKVEVRNVIVPMFGP